MRASDRVVPIRGARGRRVPHHVLPPGLFKAVCNRDRHAMAEWAEGASGEELESLAQQLVGAKWMALGGWKLLLGMLLRHGRTVPGVLLTEALDDPEVLTLAGMNPALDPEQAKIVATYLMSALGHSDVPLVAYGSAVATLLGRDRESGLAMIEELVGVVARATNVTSIRGPFKDSETRKGEQALQVLSGFERLEVDQLVRIVKSSVLPARLVPRFVIEHPSAGPPVWIAALSGGTASTRKAARELLSKHLPALADHGVRKLLIEANDVRIYERMLELAPGEDPGFLIAALMRRDPAAAARYLPTATDHVRRSVPRAVVLRMLKHSDPAVRSGGFRLLGDVGAE